MTLDEFLTEFEAKVKKQTKGKWLFTPSCEMIRFRTDEGGEAERLCCPITFLHPAMNYATFATRDAKDLGISDEDHRTIISASDTIGLGFKNRMALRTRLLEITGLSKK